MRLYLFIDFTIFCINIFFAFLKQFCKFIKVYNSQKKFDYGKKNDCYNAR